MSCVAGACDWGSCSRARRKPLYAQIGGHWREAAAAWDRLGCAYERALALLDGDEPAMREALSVEQDAGGASAVVKRCRDHLRGAGVRGVARGPRAATGADPAGLPQRELQILPLLADRPTNAEIAHRLVQSEKTVDHHISAILRKLDVHSRGEAALDHQAGWACWAITASPSTSS